MALTLSTNSASDVLPEGGPYRCGDRPHPGFLASVLVVEDDYILAYSLQRVLISAGHTVVGIASSFDEAIGIAAAERPQLALVDYKIKGAKDGVEVARHLRELGIKIIYVTGSTDEVRLIDGVSEVVPKPYDNDDLLRAVERVIASTERHGRPRLH